MIHIGILGCASIAERAFIPAILKLPEQFRLAGVASRAPEKANRLAKRFACRAYPGYEHLIADASVDAIYIPLPTGLHLEWVCRALAAGKHVYVEKSAAASLSEAETMVSAATTADRALMEGYMFQYHRQHRQLKAILSAGVIGDVRHFASAFGFPPLPSENFRYNPKLGGGVLLDAAGYPLRAAHLLLERDLVVQAATLHRNANGVGIYGSAFLSAGDGLGASLAFGFDNGYQCFYQVWGSKGRITANKAFTSRPEQTPTFTLETDSGVETIEAEADDHFVGALRAFHRAVHDTTESQRLSAELLEQSRALADIEALSR
ncbi:MULTISPECIES: Gfo/Idh/MocA family protein [Thiorhodovibrio]|uniref:Gfo/Idh/MocA family protein n=1 Tax=Thiorhodovibrio TaxID=61593 RepID=UPI001912DC99|nr:MULTISPECIES: Gfo/Idh/MocA family oxidoreductase [Thiorhodovibrio]MBK5970255.1 hypothetical protein [Thiorhodovibrio winogradskyi]WPL14819.1 Glucose--fructose oxidoreductase precursor [Thiorhodovibrio litoralis]